MKKWVLALVIGVVMLSIGATAGRDNTIRCGSDIMGPGDVCEETRAGSTVDTKTYEEMKTSHDAQKRFLDSGGRWVLVGIGALLAIGGIVGIVRVRRQRRAQAGPGQGVPPAPPGHQPQYPQQQFTPQQYPPQQHAPQQRQYPPQQQYPPQNWGPRG